MYRPGSDSSRPSRAPRLSRRSSLQLAAAGTLSVLLGRVSTSVGAQDASPASSPTASPNASCVRDPSANAAVATRWFTEVLNQDQLDVLDEIVDPQVAFDLTVFPSATGTTALKEVLGQLHVAFPDVAYTIADTLVQADMVVIRWTATGTQQDAYAGSPASNATQQWSGIHFFQFACGLITEVWSEADLLAQLGLVDIEATPAAAVAAATPGTPSAGCENPSEEEVRVIALAWSDVWNSHDVNQYAGLLSPDAVHHFGVRPDAQGLPAIQANLDGFFNAFPDLQGAVDSVVIDGDRVAIRYTTSGTFEKPFFGIEPTGDPVRWTGMSILKISCGQVVESWGEIDGYSLWQQMGMLENSATPSA